MKKSILSIICFAMAFSVYSQKLIDLYKKGTIRLIPDTEYAKGNDWNQVFRSYNDTTLGKGIGARKSLILMPDGSVVVNHAYQNYYSLFSPEGKFVKEFGIRNAKGQQLSKIQTIEGIINNNTFYTGLDNMGNMNCFDFNGKLIKKMKLNYSAKQMVTLPNRKIAVVGWVIWKDYFRDFVSIVDYNTNSEHVIWEHKTKQADGITIIRISDPNKQKDNKSISGPVIGVVRDHVYAPPIIACIGNKLLINLPETGEILDYDLNGKFLAKKRVNWPARSVSVEEQKKQQQVQLDKIKAEKDFRFRGESEEKSEVVRKTVIQSMEERLNKISEPEPIPYFSTIIEDSDGNLLFFEYPKVENNNIFHVWVFENGGRFVCKSSFVCDDYDLNINPSRMAFHNGYLYSLQNIKNASGIPMRLVRFRLSAK